ncbi:hypothetical protein [Dehalococcoides mccartyi]|jgi:hypothetical protein|uniref:Uncharacterized protein n=1 Tax=Dehalococcoides mccartyi TaxID=61435 RepID=A0A142VDE8_9CHLR|nr:hypothetical protein [Dehalococcoides mccartyi]AII61550.1 hypothetical protein X794_07075 [Dehalococcoides mccartyi CG5]AMU87347.1 hypothetical protein Dm11a5_1521 [Dehalococcoides mccartyi]AOV99992.1 hypothetical protein DCWBC2_1385 [Dehalococcoides mccartyi]AQX75238.1 hypothetical protein B1776_06810 [Dehalococcoides mccartyi]AQY73815.1 hypothetical protein B1772_07120 [Dehalococcoides mccartyi]
MEYVSKAELEKERTPSELWNWLIQKVGHICSTKEGLTAFRLQYGLLKKLPEEIAPVAIFGEHKFGSTDQILLKPVIGSQNYDAIVIDKRTEPSTETYIEITQAHEGENDYWRRCQLLNKGYVFSNAPVIKSGKGKNLQVSIPETATPVEAGVKNELDRIVDAANRKANKNYPDNTSLIIFFDDTKLSEERLQALNLPTLDDFVKKNLMNLNLTFTTLYLVGGAKVVFREYPIKQKE